MNDNKFLRTYIQTKIDGDYVESAAEPISLLRKAESIEKLYQLDDTTFYCCFRTKYKPKDENGEKESVVFVISTELTGPSTGSSSSSEQIMTLVDFVRKTLRKTDTLHYTKEAIAGKSRKSLAFIKIIKIIREDDIL